MLNGRLLSAQIRSARQPRNLTEAEFKVFSQFGDDGIIQYLIHVLAPLNERFIEFGIQDYSESNTRFLLMNDNWRGLVIDPSEEYIRRLRRQYYFWRHDLRAVTAFVDRDNVNSLFEADGFVGEIGLLSIDIDGNDYWVWEAIDVVEPTIVVCEYNAVFGCKHAITIPYDPRFNRSEAHSSNLYWGSSIKALCLMAERKGLAFVGSNSAGNNAYFVRKNRLGPLRALSAEEGFCDSRFRESRDSSGRLTFLSGSERRKAIADMEVIDVERNQRIRIGNLEEAS